MPLFLFARGEKKVFQSNNNRVHKSELIKLVSSRRKERESAFLPRIYKVVRKINLSDGKEHVCVD